MPQARVLRTRGLTPRQQHQSQVDERTAPRYRPPQGAAIPTEPMMDARKDRLLELLLVKAFEYRDDPPFELAHGQTSPYYLNCKPVTLSAEGLALMGALGYEHAKHLDIVAVGGLTLGADPLACAISGHSFGRSRPLHAFVVRKEASEGGLQRWVEGDVKPGDRVAILDDVLTSGASTCQAIDRARDAGLVVEHVIALVDREAGGLEKVRAHGVDVHVMMTLTELLARRTAALRHAVEA